MQQVNAQLLEATDTMHQQVLDTHEKAKRVFLGKDFKVEGTLQFSAKSDDAVLPMVNDDYYGSNFAKILRVVGTLYEQGLLRPYYIDCIDESDLNGDTGQPATSMNYEDWQSAAEKFKDLICFALHSLHAYHAYSLPDILRMRKFGLMINIRHRIPTMSCSYRLYPRNFKIKQHNTVEAFRPRPCLKDYPTLIRFNFVGCFEIFFAYFPISFCEVGAAFLLFLR